MKNSKTQDDIIVLSKNLNIPVVSSAGHGDVISYEHELYSGQMGPRGNKVASSLVKEADFILAIGTRLGFNSTFYSYENISKSAKIAQIDIDPIAIGRYFTVEIGIQNDVKIFLDQLNSLLKDRTFNNNHHDWVQNFINNKIEYYKKRDEDAETAYWQPVDAKKDKPNGYFNSITEVEQAIDSKNISLHSNIVCRFETINEKEKAARKRNPTETFAKRWAAKEACSKALGTGLRMGIAWKEMEVTNLSTGQPQMNVTGSAKKRLDKLTPSGFIPIIHVSYSLCQKISECFW